MSEINLWRRAFLGTLASAGTSLAVRGLLADDTGKVRDQTREPLFRVSRSTGDAQGAAKAAEAASHPLDPALDVARKGLDHIRKDVDDYTCTLVKRERIKDRLGDFEYMFAKIRNRKTENGEVKVPFSVYLYFLKPDGVKGREVIWVEGRNDGKMAAHEGGLKMNLLPTVWIKPDSFLAMNGNRYPITEAGIENLVARLIEKGERDRKRDECEVEFRKNAKINGRVCTLLKVIHPVERDYFDFHMAQIFIDDELQVPVRYAAWGWPSSPGAEMPLLEEYTYLKIAINQGLTDRDFDHENPDYNFVRRKS